MPYGAVAFQIGIDSSGNTFNSNSGAFTLTGYVTTLALPPVTSILGTLTAYIFDNSPTSGPVGSYIWKNADDPGGSGPVQSSTAAILTSTGNSFIFDATFTAGIPALPGIGSPSVPMEWTTLNPQKCGDRRKRFVRCAHDNDLPDKHQLQQFQLNGNIYYPPMGNRYFP